MLHIDGGERNTGLGRELSGWNTTREDGTIVSRRRLQQNPYIVAHPSNELITKQLGSLWVIRWFLDRLGIAEIIDRQCPVTNRAGLTHGQVITAMVANRLTAPRPLHRVEHWANQWAVEEVLGIPTARLNDDRLGRALDAIYPHLDTLKGSAAWSAIEQFGIDTAVFHWDFTSLSFYGAFDDQDQEAPTVTWGHTKANMLPGLKQVQVGLAVAPDGGIPINPTPIDGSAAEVAQVVQAMQALKETARRSDFILVGDTKLISRTNILAACAAGVHFCAPAPASAELREAFLAIPRDELQPLVYTSEYEQRKPEAERSVYLGTERSWEVTDQKGRRYTLRRIFVLSSEEQAACRKNRQRQMERAEAQLAKVQANLGTRYYPTPEVVKERVGKILRERRVTALYRFRVSGEPGAPTFTWERDPEAIARTEALDGFYVLVTNLPAEQYDASAVLRHFKGQWQVERRFADFKGPLAVNPMFLHDNRRIAALVFVVYLALLVYCLMERQVRQALQDPEKARWDPPAPEHKRRRTYAIHDPADSGKIRWRVGAPAERPTGRSILQQLQWLAVATMTVDGQRRLIPPKLDSALEKLHELLGVPAPFSG